MIDRQARAGFTLIEILIGLAIVALLMFTVGPALFRRLDKARIDTTKTTLKGIQAAIGHYNLDLGRYPETLRDLVVKPDDEQLASQGIWPYLEGQGGTQTPVDAWKNKFEYQLTPGGEHEYELFSYGPKGKGSPREQRISVWNL